MSTTTAAAGFVDPLLESVDGASWISTRLPIGCPISPANTLSVVSGISVGPVPPPVPAAWAEVGQVDPRLEPSQPTASYWTSTLPALVTLSPVPVASTNVESLVGSL